MKTEETQPLLPLGYYRDTIGGPSSAIDNTAIHIRSMIHSGELAAGERLPPERELCEYLGISRVTLRAALKVLQTLGFVTVRRGKGGGSSVVDTPSLQARRAEWVAANHSRFEQMLTFQGIVERETAALAARNAMSEDLKRLEALVDNPAQDQSAIQKWYLAFHNALHEAAHNEYLERAMLTIRGEMFVGALPEGDQPDPAELVAAYRAIAEAVRDHDSTRARQIMTEHHEFLYELLWRNHITPADETDQQ